MNTVTSSGSRGGLYRIWCARSGRRLYREMRGNGAHRRSAAALSARAGGTRNPYEAARSHAWPLKAASWRSPQYFAMFRARCDAPARGNKCLRTGRVVRTFRSAAVWQSEWPASASAVLRATRLPTPASDDCAMRSVNLKYLRENRGAAAAARIPCHSNPGLMPRANFIPPLRGWICASLAGLLPPQSCKSSSHANTNGRSSQACLSRSAEAPHYLSTYKRRHYPSTCRQLTNRVGRSRG
jgi:hypothetical protein